MRLNPTIAPSRFSSVHLRVVRDHLVGTVSADGKNEMTTTLDPYLTADGYVPLPLPEGTPNPTRNVLGQSLSKREARPIILAAYQTLKPLLGPNLQFLKPRIQITALKPAQMQADALIQEKRPFPAESPQLKSFLALRGLSFEDFQNMIQDKQIEKMQAAGDTLQRAIAEFKISQRRSLRQIALDWGLRF